MSVLRLLILTTTLLFVSGCASIGSFFSGSDPVKPVVIETKAVERTPLNIPEPAPLKTRELKWIVVTPDNIDDVWKKLSDDKTDLVLFAITDDGYEQLSLSMSEIRAFVQQQRSIIVKYKEYYEKDSTNVDGKQ